MARTRLTKEQVLTLLPRTPQRLAELTAGLAPAQLLTPPGHDEWSANDVLAHLRSCADVWGGSIAVILAEDRPTFPGIDPRTWMTKTDYAELEFRPSFDAFATQRADLLAVLGLLPPEGWSLTATVTAWGQAYEHSVLYYAQRLARHEPTHVKQIERIVKTVAAHL